MATVHFVVAGRNVGGHGHAKAGHDSIEVTGKTDHRVSAYMDGTNMCHQLIGAEHIELGKPHLVLPHAAKGEYEIRVPRGAGPDVPANGKLHVGS